MIRHKFLLFLFILIYFLNNVFALGVSPGITSFEFKPEGIESFEMEIGNSPARDQNVEIYVSLTQINDSIRAEFQDILSLDKTQISFTKDIPSEKIKVMVKFPKGISKAGTYELRVGARPVVDVGEGLSITAGNEIIILIKVPEQYASSAFAIPKKLSILSVNAKSVKKGEKAEIEIQVKSEATEVLKRVSGRVKLVYNENVLASADTTTEDLFPGETRTFTAIFYTADFPVATLPLTAEIFYGNSVEKGVGTLSILENPEALESCKKTSACSTYLAIIVILIAIIIFLLYILFRKKGVGKTFGSYDFSSESATNEGKY